MATNPLIAAARRALAFGGTAATFFALAPVHGADTPLPDCCARARSAVGSGAETLAANTTEVKLINGGYFPPTVAIRPGDTVHWNWISTVEAVGCSVTSRAKPPLFDSQRQKAGYHFSHTFTAAGRYEYFCVQSPNGEHAGVVEVVGSQPLNISTRLPVQSGENVLIGGFIASGSTAKRVIVRAIGPSLEQQGVPNALADPVLELRGPGGNLVASNDNWRDTQASEIAASGVAPQHEFESAVVATVAPLAPYTAIVAGKNGSTGVGLVEIYDLSAQPDARLVNISTRGSVQTGANVMIGGFILGNYDHAATVVVRAIGPSLTGAGINGALPDPTLDLRDSNGELVRSNNNWRDSQEAEIKATGVAPQSDLEPAIVAALPPGPYTAVVRGVGDATGVALVEVYALY
jgi:plastocyanin